MIFQKKIDRAMKWLKYKNKALDEGSQNEDEKNQENAELEKKDIIAVIISALMVFGPIVLILFLIAILMYM